MSNNTVPLHHNRLSSDKLCPFPSILSLISALFPLSRTAPFNLPKARDSPHIALSLAGQTNEIVCETRRVCQSSRINFAEEELLLICACQWKILEWLVSSLPRFVSKIASPSLHLSHTISQRCCQKMRIFVSPPSPIW